MLELFASDEISLNLFSSALIGSLATIELGFSVLYFGSFFSFKGKNGISRYVLLLPALLFFGFALVLLSPLLFLLLEQQLMSVSLALRRILIMLLAQQTGLGIFMLVRRSSVPALRSAFVIGLLEFIAIITMVIFADQFLIVFFVGTSLLALFFIAYALVVLKKSKQAFAVLLLYGLYVFVSMTPYILQIRFILSNDFGVHLVIIGIQILVLSFFFVFMWLKKRPQVTEEPLLSDYVDQVSIALTRFIPKEFLQILEKPSVVDLQLGDHVKREMTIFFSDIRQFTSLAEDLTPEENFKFINSYLARIVPAITQYGGFVDKYMGDAVLALFPNEEGPDAAVRSAIAMQKIILEYNMHRANCNYRPLSMGIGLHTGTLMLGVVGVLDRMQNTVISDAVNLASRLESITKVFNISIAISDETFKSLKDPGAYMYRFIGKVRVKGKEAPVSVFEIFDGLDPLLLERKMEANNFFEQGMMSYYRKDFTDAMYQFRKVLEIMPEDGAAIFYLDNCMLKVQA